jgi:hypothetical protein
MESATNSAEKIAIAPGRPSVMIVIPIVHVHARHGERVSAMRETLVVPTALLIEHKIAAGSHEVTRTTHLPHRLNTIVIVQEPSTP